MDDEIDIYDNLPQFEFSKELDKVRNESKTLAEAVKSLTAHIDDLKAKNGKLEHQLHILMKNISVLLKTAKKEIQRKDKIIAELREELSQRPNSSTRGPRSDINKEEKAPTEEAKIAPRLKESVSKTTTTASEVRAVVEKAFADKRPTKENPMRSEVNKKLIALSTRNSDPEEWPTHEHHRRNGGREYRERHMDEEFHHDVHRHEYSSKGRGRYRDARGRRQDIRARRSPGRRRSKSPINYRSRSPRNRSRSPKNRSRSPIIYNSRHIPKSSLSYKNRSRSPISYENRSRSPINYKDRSPINHKERSISPIHFRSKSRSPVEQRRKLIDTHHGSQISENLVAPIKSPEKQRCADLKKPFYPTEIVEPHVKELEVAIPESGTSDEPPQTTSSDSWKTAELENERVEEEREEGERTDSSDEEVFQNEITAWPETTQKTRKHPSPIKTLYSRRMAKRIQERETAPSEPQPEIPSASPAVTLNLQSDSYGQEPKVKEPCIIEKETKVQEFNEVSTGEKSDETFKVSDIMKSLQGRTSIHSQNFDSAAIEKDVLQPVQIQEVKETFIVKKPDKPLTVNDILTNLQTPDVSAGAQSKELDCESMQEDAVSPKEIFDVKKTEKPLAVNDLLTNSQAATVSTNVQPQTQSIFDVTLQPITSPKESSIVMKEADQPSAVNDTVKNQQTAKLDSPVIEQTHDTANPALVQEKNLNLVKEKTNQPSTENLSTLETKAKQLKVPELLNIKNLKNPMDMVEAILEEKSNGPVNLSNDNNPAGFDIKTYRIPKKSSSNSNKTGPKAEVKEKEVSNKKSFETKTSLRKSKRGAEKLKESDKLNKSEKDVMKTSPKKKDKKLQGTNKSKPKQEVKASAELKKTESELQDTSKKKPKQDLKVSVEPKKSEADLKETSKNKSKQDPKVSPETKKSEAELKATSKNKPKGDLKVSLETKKSEAELNATSKNKPKQDLKVSLETKNSEAELKETSKNKPKQEVTTSVVKKSEKSSESKDAIAKNDKNEKKPKSNLKPGSSKSVVPTEQEVLKDTKSAKLRKSPRRPSADSKEGSKNNGQVQEKRETRARSNPKKMEETKKTTKSDESQSVVPSIEDTKIRTDSDNKSSVVAEEARVPPIIHGLEPVSVLPLSKPKPSVDVNLPSTSTSKRKADDEEKDLETKRLKPSTDITSFEIFKSANLSQSSLSSSETEATVPPTPGKHNLQNDLEMSDSEEEEEEDEEDDEEETSDSSSDGSDSDASDILSQLFS